MTKAKFSGRDVEGIWPAQYAAIKRDLTATPFGPRANVVIVINTDFTEEQAINYLGLLAKTWHHLMFISGRTERGGNFTNVWKDYRSMGAEVLTEEYFRQHNPYIRVQRNTDGTYSFFISLPKAGSANKVLLSLLIRLANMADWATRHSAEVRLTTDTPLKWATFNEISMHVRKGLEGSGKGRGEGRDKFGRKIRTDADGERRRPTGRRPFTTLRDAVVGGGAVPAATAVAPVAPAEDIDEEWGLADDEIGDGDED
jgi:hypothetical protein